MDVFTSGRLVATLAAVVALAGLVLCALALARRRRSAVVGTALAVGGAAVGGLVVVTADGGLGTGNGLGGGVVAVVLGVVGAVLGAVALARRNGIRTG